MKHTPHKNVIALLLAALLLPVGAAFGEEHPTETPKKPTAAEIIQLLTEGNARFTAGKTLGPHRDLDRVKLAADSDQGNYALATVLACADSRVPVEVLFDTGVMDLFVARVAGNVSDTDEVGTIEYGVAHVKTPLLIILGHTGCGAVSAVTQALQGHGHPLEKSIPPLVDNIGPAVQRAIKAHPEAKDADVVPYAVEENVWQSIRDLYTRSAATRDLVTSGKLTVVGAIYDLPTGQVNWLDPDRPAQILAQVESNPKRSMEVYAGEEKPHTQETTETPHADQHHDEKPTVPTAEVPVKLKPHEEPPH